MIGFLKMKTHTEENLIRMVKPIIIAGGIGSRLWPISSKNLPKQFMKINDRKSLFQETLSRVSSKKFLKPIIVTNIDYQEIVHEQLAEEGIKADIIFEEIQKNTCPAITLALLSIEEECSVMVLPADHYFEDILVIDSFLDEAIKLIDKSILIFGIKPTAPSGEYGYIRVKNPVNGETIDSFIEKPTIERSKKYVQSTEFFWNSGMIMANKSFLIEEIKKHAEDVFRHCSLVINNLKNNNSNTLAHSDMELCPSISIDYAVLEKTKNIKFFQIKSGWSDMGTWNTFFSNNEKDNSQNVIFGNVFLEDTRNSLIISSNKIIAGIGLENLVIIDSNEGLLVSQIDKLHELSLIKQKIDEIDKNKNIIGHSNFRPWGNYVSIFKGNNYQLKIINVNPKSKLSVQSHMKRSEHWIVLKGNATVEVDGKFTNLKKNQHCFIPRESIHSLENKHKESLQVLELQYGSYLGEDDIVRYSDIYGRVKE